MIWKIKQKGEKKFSLIFWERMDNCKIKKDEEIKLESFIKISYKFIKND